MSDKIFTLLNLNISEASWPRVLTRILKVGVRDSSSVKNRSPRPNLGVPVLKSL